MLNPSICCLALRHVANIYGMRCGKVFTLAVPAALWEIIGLSKPPTLWISVQVLNFIRVFASWPSQLLRWCSLDEPVSPGASLESSGSGRPQKYRALASLLKNSITPEQQSEVTTLSFPLQHSQFKKRLTPCFHTIGSLQHSWGVQRCENPLYQAGVVQQN